MSSSSGTPITTRQLQIQAKIRQANPVPAQANPGGTVATFWAVVTGTGSSPSSLSLKIAGSSTVITGIRYADSITSPATNDVVFGLRTGTDFFVLGRRKP